MLLAHISDTHIALAGAAAPVRLAALERAVQALNAMSPRPTAVVHTGDVAHNGKAAEYDLARDILAKLEIPLYATVGNRDRRSGLRSAIAMSEVLAAEAPFIQYTVDLGDVHLLAIDTLADSGGLGDICPARLAHVEDMLTRLQGERIVAFLHHPPVPIGALHNPMQFRAPEPAQALTRLLARQSGLLGVLAGHTHRDDVVPLGPTHLSVVPSLATDLRKGRYPERLLDTPIFHVHVVGDYGLRTRQILIDTG